MAAFTSRRPQDIHLPPSSEALPKSGKTSASRKGKGKEQLHTPQFDFAGQVHASNSLGAVGAETTWDWEALTDSVASKVPPVFMKDGSHFFSLVGSAVKIHSAATGQVVSTLTIPSNSTKDGRSDIFTSAILNPNNSFQLITGSLDGRLMVWDIMEAILLQTINIAQPIHHICAHASFRDFVFVAASRSPKALADDNAVVLRVSLTSLDDSDKAIGQAPAQILPIGKTRLPTGLTISPSGAWLIATARHKVYVAQTSSLAAGFTKYVSPERLTCLAFHPFEEYFATGDDKGHVRLWYCLNDNLAVSARGVEKRTQTTSLHWHAHAVSSIAFTTNGAYLLSGGEESVLVIWQLQTGKKEFVPRVGSPINTITVSKAGKNEEEYLLSLADTTYVFVSAGSLRISRSYARIKLDPTSQFDHATTWKSSTFPLAIHSLTSTLVLPSSHPASLQIYSPSSSKLVSELEVSPSNRVSRRDEKPIEPSRVGRTVISPDGHWMATLDFREGDTNFRCEVYLKFWWWNHHSSFWTLNTRIDQPHGLKKITDMAFRPISGTQQSLQLVTTGEDGYVKIWRIQTNHAKEEEFWVVRSIFDFRSELPKSASWSPDGSLLAISLGPYVALYDYTTNALCQTLTSPECKTAIAAHFIGKSGRYLAVVSVDKLVLWDLVGQCVRWCHASSIPIFGIVPHPQEDTFLLFHELSVPTGNQATRVSVFGVTSSMPSATYDLPFGLRNIAWYTLTPVHPKFTCIGITQDWRVVLFGDQVRLLQEEGSNANELLPSLPPRRTLFQDIFGKSAFTDPKYASNVEQSSSPAVRSRNQKDMTAIFDGPAYLMPPLETLLEPILDVFMRKRSAEISVAQTALPDAEDGDHDMDVDAEPVKANIRRARVVDQKEMDTFVDLFKHHSILSPHRVMKRTANGNGLAEKVNGKAHLGVPLAQLPMKANDVQTRQNEPSRGLAATDVVSSPPSSHTTMNGKKRKKS